MQSYDKINPILKSIVIPADRQEEVGDIGIFNDTTI